MKAMLASPIRMNPEIYITDTDWWAEPKVDGNRLLLYISDSGTVRAFNRKGIEMSVPPWGSNLNLRQNAILDGEDLNNGEFYVFDATMLDDVDIHKYQYDDRRQELETFFSSHSLPAELKLMPVARSEDEKRELIKKQRANDGEGVMFKRIYGRYQEGKRSTNWCKFKFTQTTSMIITHWNHIDDDTGLPMQEAVGVGYWENGQVLEWGSVKIPAQYQDNLSIGDIIEVKYLEVQKGSIERKLREPQFVRVRRDLASSDCTVLN